MFHRFRNIERKPSPLVFQRESPPEILLLFGLKWSRPGSKWTDPNGGSVGGVANRSCFLGSLVARSKI